MDKLLEKVKANLILEHSEDDALLKMYIDAAVSYAESYQHIPEGSYMLDRVKVVADGKYQDVNTSQLKSYVRQKGNARWFSAVKLPLGVYSMAGRDSSWLNRTLRQMGEAPVIYDSLQAELTCKDLQQDVGILLG